tara:strand:- start:11850 stop:12515 length:666 start_codon:yes stop_codon:yes gene_type:complete
MKKLLLLSASFCVIAGSASAVILAEYTFDADSYGPSTTATGIEGSNVTGGSGLSTSPVLSGTGNPAKSIAPQGLSSTSEADAVAANDYIELKITADSGYTLSFTSLDIDLQRSNDQSATNWFIRSSLDSYASTIDSITSIATSPSAFASYTIDLSDAAYQNLSGEVTFRLYGYGAVGENPSLRQDNITFNGSAAIPEPSSTATLFLGAAAVTALLRRKARS